MRRESKNLLVVLGPTASGKTGLAVRLADELGGEVVSADSRQVYRGLNLGAGKDLEEYQVDGRPVRYHLIDIVDLDCEFSVFEYQRRFFETFEALHGRGVLPVLAGGTGLYIEAVLRGYRMATVPRNPELRAKLETQPMEELAARLRAVKLRLHNITDLTERDRLIRAIEIAEFQRLHEPEPLPEVRAVVLGTRWPREELRQRIRNRLKARLEAGMIEEVRGLLDRGVPPEKLEFLGLEYRHIADYLRGIIRDPNDLFQKLYAAICRFAKRQETWFRRMERHGVGIHWIDRAEFGVALKVVSRYSFGRRRSRGL